ncbi:MAG: hypothetical protein AAF823_10055 [Planctomycetota bacterium]
MQFTDPWNPTEDELRQWAYTNDASYPAEDWELVLTDTPEFQEAVLEFASDDHCPQKRYFLAVLYLIVGEEVRRQIQAGATSRNTIDLSPGQTLTRLINKGDRYPSPSIQQWQERTRSLAADLSSFDYDEWCKAGYDNEDQ